MAAFIALLRAVNVGGTGKLPMTELKAMCVAAGFAKVQTFIASGNVVFESKDSPSKIKAKLEARLGSHAGKPVGVIVRTLEEMADILKFNPFPESNPSQTVAIFLDERPPANTVQEVKGLEAEELRLGTREIYVHYPEGIGQSKLRIPAAKNGTARNMNTVAKLVALAGKL